MDAVILANAGLRRIGRASEATQILGADRMTPALGAGQLIMQMQGDDESTLAVRAPLADARATRAAVTGRSLLRVLVPLPRSDRRTRLRGGVWRGTPGGPCVRGGRILHALVRTDGYHARGGRPRRGRRPHQSGRQRASCDIEPGWRRRCRPRDEGQCAGRAEARRSPGGPPELRPAWRRSPAPGRRARCTSRARSFRTCCTSASSRWR
ncbi:hypothetical protein ACFQ2B_35895 [Streptomyces stramineus]